MERLREGRNKLEAEQRLASGKHHTRLGEHLFDLGLQLGFPFVSWHARRLSMAAQREANAVEQGEPCEQEGEILTYDPTVRPNNRSNTTKAAAPRPKVKGKRLAPANHVAVPIAPSRLSPWKRI